MLYYPVALPALLAFALGLVVAGSALLAARARGRAAPKAPDARRDRGSVAGIIVQGIGIGTAGVGPIAVRSDWTSPAALGSAALILALMLMAAALFDSASRAMGRNWALVARTRGDGALVTSGPFAWVRNPIYVALALFLIAMALAYGHYWQLVAAIPVFAIGTGMRVRAEERVLRASFGPAYDAYAARVARFVPGLF